MVSNKQIVIPHSLDYHVECRDGRYYLIAIENPKKIFCTLITAYLIAGWITLWLLCLTILFNFAILLALVTTACKPLRRTIKWFILKARAFTANILSKIESELFISFVSSFLTHRKDTDAKQ